MELYLGGYAQNKYEYVKQKMSGRDVTIVNHLHLWFLELLQQNEEAEAVILKYCETHPDCVIICDEIGNGIVPMEQEQREYRERLGRLLVILAQRADRVERIVCGIGQRIK